MKNKLRYIFMFAAGAAIGSAVTWKLIKTKYERIAQEEIDSVKEVFSRKEEREENAETAKKTAQEMHPEIEFEEDGLPTREFYKELINKHYGYYANEIKNDNKEVDDMKPYVIPPDEFGDLLEYDTISLTYYADKVLTDDMDEPVEDVDDVVGIESLDHFGEWEDDSVFVRNDKYKAYYEILLDERRYSDIINENPHLAEDE